MRLFRSLTAKYSFVGLVVLVFFGAFSYASFEFTRHMKGEAATINLAGQLRYRVFQMAWYGQQLAEQAHPVSSRPALQAELSGKIDKYDVIITTLRTGSAELMIKSIVHYGSDSGRFESLVKEWEQDLRPALKRLTVLSLSVDEAEVRLLLEEYETAVPRFINDADALVKALEIHYDEELERFGRLRFAILGGFAAAIGVIILYMRRNIVMPVKYLTAALLEVKRGNLGARVAGTGRDEIGQLADGFNETAQTLEMVVDENVRLSRVNKTLYEASHSLMTDLRIDILLEKIVQEARYLIAVKYAAIGIVDDSGKYEYFTTAGVDRETLARMTAQHGLPRGEGLLGYMMREGKPVRLDDIGQHPASVGFPPGHPAMKTFLGVPVLMQERVIGRLYLSEKLDSSAFTPEDEQVAQSLANTAALVVNNARLLHTVVARNEELGVLSSIAKATNSSLDLHVMLQKVLDTIMGLASLKLEKKGAIFLCNEEAGGLKLVACSNFSDEQKAGCDLVPAGDCLCGICAETKEMVRSDSDRTDERHTKAYPGASEHGHVILPLQSRDKMLGVLCLYLPAGPKAADEEMRLYKAIAQIISISLQNALNHHQVAMLAQSLDSSNDVIVITNANGRIQHVNPEAMLELGYRRDELIGQPVSIMQSPDNPPELGEEIYRQTLEGGWHGEVINRRKDGTDYPVYLTTSVVRNADGKTVSLVGIARDITKSKEAEEALRRSEARLREAQHIARLGSWDWDIVNNRLLWSDEICGIFGLSPQEFKGTYEAFLEKVHPDDRGAVKHAVDDALSGQRPYSIDHRIVLPDGSERVVHEQAEVHFGASGKPVRMAGTVQDITERKRSEEELRKYSASLLALNEASNSVIGITDTKNIFQAICDGARKLFSLKMVWIGLTQPGSFAVTPAAQAGDDNGYLATINVTWDDSSFGQGPVGMSIKTRKPFLVKVDDERFTPWVREAAQRGFAAVLGVPLLCAREECVGTLVFYSEQGDFFAEDVTRLCQIFANQAATAIENARLVEGLENEVQERTKNLEDANSELQATNKELVQRRREAEAAKAEADEANRTKSEFLANMSHELRTPLNSIIGFSDLLQQGMAGTLTEEQRDFIVDIAKSGKHLLNLINDILDLSKVEAGKMELETTDVDVNDLIKGSLVMFREKAMKRRIALSAEIEEEIGLITADERKIKQVLFNLLSNALKFTPDGGSVRVKARKGPGPEPDVRNADDVAQGLSGKSEELDIEVVEISVADTGIGIANDDLPRLFKPFQQLESTYTKKFSGTGLGLNLCKKFVELHGGSIRVESETGKGSRFVFLLPVNPAGKGHVPPADETRILTWDQFSGHVDRIISMHRRSGMRFGLLRIQAGKPATRELLHTIAKILRGAVRKHELLSVSDREGCCYLAILSATTEAVVGAAERMRQVMQNAGYEGTIEVRSALFPDDGGSIDDLLHSINGA